MTVILLWEYEIFMKDIYNFLDKNKKSFTIIIPLLYFSSMLSYNSHVLFYFNGLNPCIKHLYMFLNIWNLFLLREAGNRRSCCSDDNKYGEFIVGQPEQQFKIQSNFGIFDPAIGEG